jgi:hypothetical protein
MLCMFGSTLKYVINFFFSFLIKIFQPALLYLVPACLGAPFVVALLSGEVSALFAYDEEEEEEEEEDDDENETDDMKKDK